MAHAGKSKGRGKVATTRKRRTKTTIRFSCPKRGDLRALDAALRNPYTRSRIAALNRTCEILRNEVGYNMLDEIRRVWDQIKDKFIFDLQSIRLATSDTDNEPRSRMIVDRFLVDFGLRLAREAGIPVFKLALEERVEGETEDQILRGFVDYVTKSAHAALPGARGSTSTSRINSYNIKGQDRIGVRSHYCVIEDKGLKYSDILGEKFLKQVSKEALAMMKEKSIREMPWILTTSTTWVFGLIIEDNANHYRIFKTEEFFKFTNRLHLQSEKLLDIMTMLVCWTMCPEKTIRTIFP